MVSMRCRLFSLALLLLAACGTAPAGRGGPEPAPEAAAVMVALERALEDPDRGVRYGAILALGKGGVDPEVLTPLTRDEHWCVRTEALWWQKRLAIPGRGADLAVDEHYEVPEAAPPPPLDAAATRLAVEALGAAERAVRVRAALDLGTGGAGAQLALEGALRDTSWRVRAAALKNLGRHTPDAALVAPFLRSEIVPEAEAARDTLRRLGAPAAAPTADAMATAHYGALHWGLSVFEALGQQGAAGVPALIKLLAHADVNGREVAARCLRMIGPSAREAAPALTRALEDPRLCVIANASLALGALGLTAEALKALEHPRARVRAYAAFALGWALGTARGIDQVPFEHRLPVLDIGSSEPTPGPAELDAAIALREESEPEDEPDRPFDDTILRAIWSPRADIAIRAAAELGHEYLDARHAERVMELLLPEGGRRGAPGDFEKIRSIIGSAEVPAYLMYVFKAGLSEGRQESIGGNFHRLALPWHLPVLCWFTRTHDDEGQKHAGELWFSQWYSQQHARVTSMDGRDKDPGPELRRIVRRTLEDAMNSVPAYSVLPLPRWHINTLPFRDEDAAWLLAAAPRLKDDQTPGLSTWGSAWWAVVRALGRLEDDASRAYLLKHATPWAEGDAAAIAALVRRGDPDALAELTRRAQAWTDETVDASACLLRLIELRPALGRRLAAARIGELAGPLADGDEGDEYSVALFSQWSLDATYMGIEVDASDFLGLATLLQPHLAKLTPTQLAELLRHVPLCNTRRIADALLVRLEQARGFEAFGVAGSDLDELYGVTAEMDHALASLYAYAPERVLRLLRRFAAEAAPASKHCALSLLLRLGDAASADAIRAWAIKRLPDAVDEQSDGDWRRFPGKATEDYLAKVVALQRKDDEVPRESLADLAVLRGLSPRLADGLKDVVYRLPSEGAQALMDRVATGSMEKAQAQIAALDVAYPPYATNRLLWQTRAGDAAARAELWSICRATRYRPVHHAPLPLYALHRDLSTLPNWLTELESNCCRVSDGLDSLYFEDRLHLPSLYGSESNGVGTSLKDRALRWLRVMGGDFVWSPIIDAWIPRPE